MGAGGWLEQRRVAAIVAIAMLPAALLLVLVLRATGGVFIYSLDDPYIHLALARSILHGTYGLNPGELSAPASSIVWPFLLAPFAALPERLFELVPLAANLGLLAASLAVLLRLLPAGMDRRFALPLLLLLAWGLNLYGLVFTGMEHSLQLMLVLVGLEAFFSRPVDGTPRPTRFYVALALLPLVRYEGLALSLALLGVQFLRGDRRRTILAGAVALAGVAGFSLFLHGLGLGWLPYSVIAKSTATGVEPAGLARLWQNVTLHVGLFAGGVAAAALFVRRDPLLAAALLGFTLLHFAFGRFGWFGRYETYWVATVAVIAMRHPLAARLPGTIALLGFVLVLSDLHTATDLTPRETRAIWSQQGQMGRIARILDRPVAVNDLGLVAFRSRRHVLDLFGLSSGEALQARLASPRDSRWIAPMMARHGIRHLMIYPDWFPNPPPDWIRVANLVVPDKMVLDSTTVGLFATDPAAAQDMRAALAAYHQCCVTPAARIVLLPPPPS